MRGPNQSINKKIVVLVKNLKIMVKKIKHNNNNKNFIIHNKTKSNFTVLRILNEMLLIIIQLAGNYEMH